MKLDVAIAQVVLCELKSREWTCSRLADRCDVDVRNMHRSLHGGSKCKGRREMPGVRGWVLAQDIARGLGWPLSELIRRAEVVMEEGGG